MDLLCLMGLFPKEYEETILKNSIGGVQNAANKFQWGIVKGLDEMENIQFKILNSLYIGSYPKRYRELQIPSFKFCHVKTSEDFNIGFTNLTVIKNMSRYFGIKREIDKWAVSNTGENKAIIAYAMASPFVEILNYVKKKYPYITCCLVVPDLPEYMNASLMEKKIYKILKKLQVYYFKKKLKPVDCYVLLTKYMREWFDWEIKYAVIEGISSRESCDFKKSGDNKKKAIVYAGMIEEKYGVLDLVKAFMQIENPEWTLELFGSGSSLGDIEKLSRQDSRIHIRGMVSNDKVIEEQKEAELLVNPRNDSHKFTKSSFPSKVIEYMISGTTMMGYKLSGMPDEYESFFYKIDEGKNGMKNTLQRVMNLSSEERIVKGEKALQFIIQEKSAKQQCKKMIDLINDSVQVD